MKLDLFLVSIACAVLLAFVVPWLGAADGPLHMGLVTDCGVALVFFLHGAAVSPASMRQAVANWPLHALVQASTYVLFPLIGLLVWLGLPHLLSPPLRMGFFFLCVVSSTISSSVAMTAMARGNVAGAIFDATLSGLLGMVLTPLLLSLVMAGGGDAVPMSSQLSGILIKLMLPFALGQIFRPLLLGLLTRHKALVGKADRVVIVMIVYTAFCDAAAAGLWNRGNALDIVKVLVLCSAVLALVLALTTVASRALGFSREDEIAAVFCGSKKSLANGAPIAKVIFGGTPGLGMILVPLLLYHQLQLLVCTVLARRYASGEDSAVI